MDRPLPFTPRPQAGEAPLSVLRRGALGNHHGSSVRFACAVNPSLDHSLSALGAVARDPERLGHTLKSMGVDAEQTEQVVYRRVGKGREDDVQWNGLRVPLGDLQFRRSKLCMACYLENGFASSLWDHVASMTCAKHQIYLDDACPCCGIPWTPDQDPLRCGCDPLQMAASQEHCGREVASVLDRIVRKSDQAGIRVLSGVWSVLNHWKDIGLRLSRSLMANAVWNLSAGRWPSLPALPVGTAPVNIHPRVALAPLLASQSSVCVGNASTLLRKPAPDLIGDGLVTQWWPATTAMAVLGTKRVPFEKLVYAGLLTPREDGCHSAAAINELLWQVKGHPDGQAPKYPLSTHRHGPDPVSLAHLIVQIKAGEITSYYCPIDTGLDGLLCERVTRPIETTMVFGLKDVAARLGTNTESIRAAIRLGLLDGVKGTPRSSVEWNINGSSLDAFEQRYVFGSAIAKEHGVPIRTIAHRLRHAGLLPVSGPDIDGGVTYLFVRAQLAKIDLTSVLIGSYHSRAGRKKNGEQPDRHGLLSSQQSASILGISVRQLRGVVRDGWIEPAAVLCRRLMFSEAGVIALRQSLDMDYLALEIAAEKMKQSVAQFRRTWVGTRTIRSRRFAAQTLIAVQDLERIQEMWRDLGTSSSIGRGLNRQRWLCPNLAKMEQMPAPTILGSNTCKVHLYPRTYPVLSRYKMT